MKKILILLLLILLSACSLTNKLPKPELEDGIRGEQFGIDKNINEKTIDNYLGRSDAVYRDMRMLKDEANYEAIGGDSYLSAYVKGFEIVPYPFICNVNGLPSEVGESYVGATLFTQNSDGTYTSNYQESDSILEELFPKNKVIFLMCGGGGYAGMMRQLLIAKGYDKDKIYNVGGFWYYEGENAISTKDENGNYNFNSAPYHEIDFRKLTPVDGYDPSKIVHVTARETNITKLENIDSLKKKITEKESFVLLVSYAGCPTCASFKPIIEECVDKVDIKIYEIPIVEVEDFLDAELTPTVYLYNDGEIVDSLRPDSNDDIKYYENVNELVNWINNK